MTDLRNVNIVEIESVTRPWRNALHHRNTFVEGIRKIASRNMAHVQAAKEYCGVLDDAEEESEDWIADVQKKMLEDQQLENTPLNRALLLSATFFPLQVYACLFYAEVEFFYEKSKDVEFYRDSGMSDCLDSHKMLINDLRKFRDSFLHPSPESDPCEISFLNWSPFSILPELQTRFDEYLIGAQEKIFGYLQSIESELPREQRVCLLRKWLSRLAVRTIGYKDSEGMRQIKTQMQRLQGIDGNTLSWSPDRKQEEIASRLGKCLNDISTCEPEQRYTEPTGKQTPMPSDSNLMKEFLRRFRDASSLSLNSGNRHEAQIVENRSFFVNLLTGIHVLLNEAAHEGPLVDIRQKRMIMDDDEFAEYGESRVMEHGMQYWNEAMAPCRVALALLYEPLRVYKAASERNPSISVRKIGDYLSVRDRLETLRNFRNSVFHVWNVETDPGSVDPSMAETHADNAIDLSVFSELLRFFLAFNTKDLKP